MSWLRLGGAVAAVVIATSVAVACGDTTSITIVEAADGGAEAAPDGQVGQPQPDAGSDSATADGGDAGDAATVDGGDDGAVACSTAPTGTVNAVDPLHVRERRRAAVDFRMRCGRRRRRHVLPADVRAHLVPGSGVRWLSRRDSGLFLPKGCRRR
jgi:hypothetical protein